MKNLSTLLSIFVGMTVFIHITPAKAELAPGINFDRLTSFSFNSKLTIKDRLKKIDVNQDLSSLLSENNSMNKENISLSTHYLPFDDLKCFNFNNMDALGKFSLQNILR
jgi:hypothetical protein